MFTLGYDSQGWPLRALTLKEILMDIGFEEKDGKISIDSNAELLNAYPQLLEDDGMGYGVRPEYIVEASGDIYDTKVIDNHQSINHDTMEVVDSEETITINVFNFFREPTQKKIDEDFCKEP